MKIDVTTNSSKLFVTGFKNPDNTLTVLAFNYWGGINDTEDIQLVVGAEKIDFSIPPRSAVTFTTIDSGQIGLEDISTNNNKELVKIVDLMGREVSFKPNTPLIYIYSDGTRERVLKLEE
jgi:hypothetical protein